MANNKKGNGGQHFVYRSTVDRNTKGGLVGGDGQLVTVGKHKVLLERKNNSYYGNPVYSARYVYGDGRLGTPVKSQSYNPADIVESCLKKSGVYVKNNKKDRW